MQKNCHAHSDRYAPFPSYMLYLTTIEERLIAERQFSGGSRTDILDHCVSGEDVGVISAAVVNSELSPNVQFTEWFRSCQMFFALS
jgi:hypothetical protein